ncbi:MAG TPA: DUF4105 domain-containing protein [Kofleriaceae bacterium]|nr:DUF4105 domain-containing protein [Kofleriaceae bacterium]
MRAAFALLILVATAVPAWATAPNCRDGDATDDRIAFMDVQREYMRVETLYPEIYKNYPVVELITMGVGGLIWERHGHIALCVRNSPTDEDCYNYGIGDFHHPVKMGAGFFRGTHSFYVGRMDPGNMFMTYVCADRTVYVQPLPLTDAEEQDVIKKLEFDVKEENKSYAYDHFWDNCTTRVRDDLDHATGGKLKALTGPPDDRTYRDLARGGFYGMRVPLLITDIAMGRVTDRVPTYWEKMFLPDYLREAAEKAWGIKPVPIYTREGPPPLEHGPSGRILFALVILLLTSPAWIFRLVRRFEKTGIALAVMPYWLLGTIFWFLAIISPLPYVRWNESCLVLLPTDLMLVWFLSPERRKKYARGRVYSIVVVAALLAVNVLKQPLWPLLLWPLVPAAVVGFWPAKPEAEKAPEKASEKKPGTKGKAKAKKA